MRRSLRGGGLIDANGQAYKVEKDQVEERKFLEQDVEDENLEQEEKRKQKAPEGAAASKKNQVLQEYNEVLADLQKHFYKSMNLQENSVKDPTVLSKFTPHFNTTGTNVTFIYYHKIFCSFGEALFTFFICTNTLAPFSQNHKDKMLAKAILHKDPSLAASPFAEVVAFDS